VRKRSEIRSLTTATTTRGLTRRMARRILHTPEAEGPREVSKECEKTHGSNKRCTGTPDAVTKIAHACKPSSRSPPVSWCKKTEPAAIDQIEPLKFLDKQEIEALAFMFQEGGVRYACQLEVCLQEGPCFLLVR